MIELEKVHLVQMLQMPGGHSEMLMRGEKNGVVTSLHLNCDRRIVEVVREVNGVEHKRMVPLSNIQSMEEYGRKPNKKAAQGGSKRSSVEQGEASSGGRSGKKKAS